MEKLKPNDGCCNARRQNVGAESMPIAKSSWKDYIPATNNHSNTMNAKHLQWERLTVTATAVATDCAKMKTVHIQAFPNSVQFWPAWRDQQV